MARRSRAYSFNNRTKKLFLSGTVVAETNESNVATVSGLLDSNTQSNITSVGTLTSVTATGNIETTSGFFLGNGSQLTGLSSTVKNYVDGTTNTANTAMKGYVDSAITTANTAMKGYVDDEISNLVDSSPGTLNTLNEIATALGNDPNLATTLTNTITTANTAVVGYIDSEITTVGSDITTANTAMKGYVDNLVSTANTAVVGYVDNEITNVESFVNASNTAMKGYVDGEIASVPPGYADSDVADYLPTYSGNVGANYVNANFFTGNGSQLTGLPAGYSDADVDAHLSGGTGVTYSSGTISIGQAVGTGNSPTFSSLDLNGNLTVDTDTLYVDSANNEVGIGTNAPTRKLHVKSSEIIVGVIESTNADFARLNFQNANTTNSPYIGSFNNELRLNSTNSSIVFQDGATEKMRITSTGNVGIGNTAPLHKLSVTGNAFVSGTIYGQATSAQYADLAEKYIADKDYAPGTVVAFGGGYEITESTQSHQRSVAGVISTQPAYLMNSDEDGLPVALQGRVPCKVRGPIDKGDLVVASDIPGVAQKLNDAQYLPGCVIGKALNSIEDNEVQSIEVVVGRV